ncbi:MAG: hypothetical protein ACR2I0_02775 [Rhodoferax sp.]
MGVRHELPSALTIYTAVATREALLAWVEAQDGRGAGKLELSAAQVEEVDGAGLQLIAALGNMERPWVLVQGSEVFSQACRTLGLARWLEQAGALA